MSKRIAVLTDATSAGFWFPKWHQYYASEFGAAALHVVTYRGYRGDFRDFDLGAVWDVPRPYDDRIRAQLLSNLARALLVTHDVVVRCDVDEFLIPDLRQYESLKDYLIRCDKPYVSAYGVDVFEREGDAPLDMSAPILVSQRRHGIINTSLHKTAIVTEPMDWSPGFHASNVIPSFDSLYLFHMKFSDVERRAQWFQFMKSTVPEGGSEYTYFSFTHDQMKKHKAMLSGKPCVDDGWFHLENVDAQRAFLSTVTMRSPTCYQGIFSIGDSAFVIPNEFHNKI